MAGLSFGVFQLATASGTLYSDANQDGTLDDGESGLAGWTINLLNSSGNVVASATTDASGNYTLSGVGPGSFTIQEALQAGYIQTAPSTGSISIISSSGAQYPNENLGVYKAVSLAVSGLHTVPSSGLQSSESLVVEWTDTNTGTMAAAGSYYDQIVITNTTTSKVLAKSLVYYNAATEGNLGAGASALQQYSFALPFGSAGVGQIQFTVTADENSNVSTPFGEPNRTATITESSTLALYPDLAASAVSPSESSGQFGDTLTVGWTVTNAGQASATGPWVDNVYLSPTPALGSGAIYLGSFTEETSGRFSHRTRATAARRPSSSPSTRRSSAGTYYLVVLVDAGGVVNESDLTTQAEQCADHLTAAAAAGPLGRSSVTSSLTAGQPGQSETVTLDGQERRHRRGRPARGLTASTSRPDGKLTDATLLGSVSHTRRPGGERHPTPARSPPRCRQASPTALTRSSS